MSAWSETMTPTRTSLIGVEACSDDKVEDVASVVGRLGNVPNAAERLQQIGNVHGVNIVPLIDVHVKVTAYNDCTSVDREQL